MKTILLSIILSIILSGCGVAEYFTLGKNKSYCEEQGCDYTDAGVCENPFDILQNKEKANKEAYKNIQCRRGN